MTLKNLFKTVRLVESGGLVLKHVLLNIELNQQLTRNKHRQLKMARWTLKIAIKQVAESSFK